MSINNRDRCSRSCVRIVVLFVFTVTLPVQAQECGTESADGKEVPWEAGIYNRVSDPPYLTWEIGGSLISRKVVITTGKLVKEIKNIQEQLQGSPGLVVAVGRLSQPMAEPTDESTQTSDIKEIIEPPLFHQPGLSMVTLDEKIKSAIALIITVEEFKYNDYIRPVCVDFDFDFEEQQLRKGSVGKTAGWGNPELREKSWHLEHYVKTLDYVDFLTCAATYLSLNDTDRDDLPPSVFVLTLAHMICVDAKQNNSAICHNDGGIGIAFPATRNGVTQYYLRGVLIGAIVDESKICTTDTFYSFSSIRSDNSFISKYLDESPDKPPKQIGKCLMPQYPEHGSYTTNVTRIANVSGGEETVLVALAVSCDRGYGVAGSSAVNCYNGYWAESMPTCARTCELKAHPSVEYRCVVSGQVVGSRACADYEASGTVVSPLCRQHYYSNNNAFMRCKEDGQWDQVIRCSPDCGRVTPDGKELVVGGTAAKRGELPWHAGVYSKTTEPYMQICGGSIVSNKLVISAAHCFWTDLEKQLPASRFAVAVGKLYRPWNDPVDDAQKSDVQEIHIPERYQGIGASFQDDIAVLVVSSAFVFKPYVRPVCLSFDLNFDRLQLQTANKGKVAGWGLTAANGKASPVLQVVELPYVEVGTCIADSPKDFGEYITSDKICAGVKDSSTALCKGDSGGGLAFPASERGVERHYLRGVVSTAPRGSDDACNTAAYTSFTQLLKHEDFIKPFLNEL